jgi:hypothetical protein
MSLRRVGPKCASRRRPGRRAVQSEESEQPLHAQQRLDNGTVDLENEAVNQPQAYARRDCTSDFMPEVRI